MDFYSLHIYAALVKPLVKDIKITVVAMLKPGEVFDELAVDTVTPECFRY